MDLVSQLSIELRLIELIADDCCRPENRTPATSASKFDLTSFSPPGIATISKFGVVSVLLDIKDHRKTIAFRAPKAQRTQKKIGLWHVAENVPHARATFTRKREMRENVVPFNTRTTLQGLNNNG